ENTSTCFCLEKLVFTSNCQKYCENCFIFFIGCRYCLTTNIIFGVTNRSQCKKCKRVSIFDITKIISINSGDSVLDNFLFNIRNNQLNQLNITKFVYDLKSNKYLIPSQIYTKTLRTKIRRRLIRYIPYSQLINVKKIEEGGFSIIYQATWLDSPNYNSIVILKRFKNLQYAKKYFFKELESNHRCYKLGCTVNETFGFTKDPKLDDYILVMQYASEGDLHKYLQKEFPVIDWKQKIRILNDISLGLFAVHDSNFIHRDLHSGNILVNNLNIYICYKIGDLGLSRSANDTSLDDEIYGVIPYIAPEIFKGSAFSKESDIYSLGMIMWELTTGCKPFANVEHDHSLIFNIIDGVRPEITKDTPECYANLMKSCWDSDPKKRPSICEIRNTCIPWYKYYNQFIENKYGFDFVAQFSQAELKWKDLIVSKKLGPEFSEKSHPKAIYTSRSLNSYISKRSFIFSKRSSIFSKRSSIFSKRSSIFSKCSSIFSKCSFINSSNGMYLIF
ncbi:kinase-like domain-containing protein, partial [Rhizophagus irregularis DAOM 181602=DAOM 197198]